MNIRIKEEKIECHNSDLLWRVADTFVALGIRRDSVLIL